MSKNPSSTSHVREKALRKRQARNAVVRATQEAVKKREAIIRAFTKPQALTEELVLKAIGGEAPSYSYSESQPYYRVLQDLKDLCNNRPSVQREQFGKMVLHIFRRAPKLLNKDHLKALWRMYALNDWLRPLEEWRPRGHSEGRLYRGLVDHLYAKYRTPGFLYSAFQNNDDETLLFVHLAQGGSVVGAVKSRMLPTVMTSRMCHLFMQETEADTIPRAVRAAQLRACGGSSRMIHAVGRTFLGERFWGPQEEFWLTVLQWLGAQPMLDPVKVGPLLDYIRHRRGAQPAFSMKGRSILVLLREMEAWHEELARKKILRSEVFIPSGFTPGEWDLSLRDEQDNVLEFDVWTVKEILSSKELQAEGRSLHHCVFSYGHRVQEGKVSIWSLARNGERLLTVSVSNESRRITEARGLCNRMPQGRETPMLQRWADQNRLDLFYR